MERQCGECAACCISSSIQAINKQRNCWCPNLYEKGYGCRIYERKPETCTKYNCAWLLGVVGEEEDRPDKLGLIVDNVGVIENTIVVKPTSPGKESTPEGIEFINNTSKKLGIPIIVIEYDQVGINRVVGRGLADE